MAFFIVIGIDLCCGLEEYNYLDFRFLFFVDEMLLGDRCNFFCFFRSICEFNFTFMSNVIGENAAFIFIFIFENLFRLCFIIQKLDFLFFSLSYWENYQHTRVSLAYIAYSK